MSPPATLRNLSAQTIVSKQQALLEGQPKARSQKFMAMFLETIIAIFIESGQFSPVNHNKRLMKDMEDMTKHNELVSDDVPSKDSNDDFNPIELFYPEHPSFIVEINFEENPKRCASFYRHLIGNCSEKIKLQKLPGDNFSFMVILPVLALISVTPDKHVVQIYSLSKSSLLNAKIVYETIQETKDDFKRSQYEFLEITDTPGRQALRPSTHASGVTEVENCALYQTLLRLFMHCCPESSTPTLREDNNSTISSEATSSVYLEEESTDVREETNVEEIEVGITSLSLRQNCKTTRQENKKTQTSTQHDCEKESEIKNLKATVSSLEEHLSYSKRAFSELKSVSDATQANMREELYKLRNKVDDLEKKLESAEEEQQQTLLELGRHSVENGRLINEMKFIETFKSKPVSVTSTATQVPQQPLLNQAPTLPQGEAASNTQSSRVIVQNPLGTSAGISVQVSENSSGIEGISLANVPATFVERTVYNHYNLLLLAISDALLIRDVQDVKTWASRMFSINVTIDMSIHDVFLELDRKKVISASNLNLLRSFFEEKQRFDLVHLIDCFESGDYNHFSTSKINGVSRVRRQSASHSAESRGPCSETRIIPDVSSTRRTNSSQSTASNQSKVLEVDESFTVKQPKHKMSTLVTTRSPMDTLGNENGNGMNGSRQNTVQDRMTGSKNVSVGNVQRSNRETGCSQAGKKDKQSSENSKAQSAETPGNHSASPQECDSDDDDDSQWLCSHYKRRCHVKFDCCNRYWPCHRCHNNAGKCSENKLKSRDTKYIKCVKCGKEQKFTAQSQFCNKCHTKLARYFCAICKHLTGTDDHPYHCSKCGICRIHHDRSFHCDVCGVCLDVQLRGNHKCRAGSAHDECCICLEDAFTGCQILPCSHKVHKECATRMIRSGITRCPICRESFAHKLEKRPLPSSKKSNGKY